MLRRLLLPLAVLVAVFVSVASGYAATVSSPKLLGVSGPGFSIVLKTSSGKAVKNLKAGTYAIKVEDKSSIHNFHLFGPGVNKATSVPFTGTKTWTVKLKPGTYTFQCDVHAASGMKGVVKVTK